MHSNKRLVFTLAAAGGVLVGGVAALAEAPGASVAVAGVPTHAKPGPALDPRVSALRAEESALETAILAAKQQLAAEVAQQSQQQGALSQQAARQSQQAAQLAAQQATLAQEAAQLAAAQQAAAKTPAPAPATHATTGASGAHSGEGSGGDD